MMIYVMLPAYNEEKGLQSVLSELEGLAKEHSSETFRVVVVDDGSADRTSEVAQSFRGRLDLELIRFERNRGVGEVFKEGLHFICQESRDPTDDICIVLDSDHTQNPRTMIQMADLIRKGNDIVIASRFEGEGKMIGCPWHRQILSYGVSWLLRCVIGLPKVKDYSTFYRAYRVSVLKEGFKRYGDRLLEGKGFAAIAGMLVKLGNVTGRFAEVPMILRYDLKSGSSGIKIMKTIQGYFGLMYGSIATRRFRDGKPSLPAASARG